MKPITVVPALFALVLVGAVVSANLRGLRYVIVPQDSGSSPYRYDLFLEGSHLGWPLDFGFSGRGQDQMDEQGINVFVSAPFGGPKRFFVSESSANVIAVVVVCVNLLIGVAFAVLAFFVLRASFTFMNGRA